MTEIRDRGAVVTGGASGIGAGIALALAEHGMRVLIADIEPDAAEARADELRKQGFDALATQVDVADPASVDALASYSFELLGDVAVLCNNAGVYQGGPLWKMTPADWEWLTGVNLNGVTHGIRSFVPRLIAQDRPARVLNTASLGGWITGPELGMYSATKYAVVGISEALAQDLAETQVGVSVLCPGWVDTRLGESERNRPTELGKSAPRTDPLMAILSTGMSPAEVGRHAVRGILEDAPYVFTQGEFSPLLEQRFQRALEAMKHADDPL